MIYLRIIIIISTVAVLSSCSSFILTSADFSWPLESVLKIDNRGFVKEERHSITFNTLDLFLEETQDSLGYAGKSLHLIRNSEGYYFMTAPKFKNVYVFGVKKNEFVLENKISFGEYELKNPAFNQRNPYIELIDDTRIYKLTSDGIEESE